MKNDRKQTNNTNLNCFEANAIVVTTKHSNEM